MARLRTLLIYPPGISCSTSSQTDIVAVPIPRRAALLLMNRVRLLSCRAQLHIGAGPLARRFFSGPAAPSPSPSPSPAARRDPGEMAGKRFSTVKVSGEPPGSVLLTPHVVTLKTNEAALVRLSRSWLRDSCQCERCVDPHSGQKRFAEADVPLNPPISSATLAANQSLRIVWADGVLAGGAARTYVYPKALWSQRGPGGRPRYA